MGHTEMIRKFWSLFGFAVLAVAGCSNPVVQKTPTTATASTFPATDKPISHSDEVTAERNKLSPADRALVDAQEWCVISDEQELGAMKAPIKLDIGGQPVFICCAGCKRKAEANPEATLAKVAELKTKAAKLKQ